MLLPALQVVFVWEVIGTLEVVRVVAVHADSTELVLAKSLALHEQSAEQRPLHLHDVRPVPVIPHKKGYVPQRPRCERRQRVEL